MNKIERDIVMPLKPKSFLYSLMARAGEERKINQTSYFSKMNFYHPNIKPTIETAHSKFLGSCFQMNLVDPGSVNMSTEFCWELVVKVTYLLVVPHNLDVGAPPPRRKGAVKFF